MKKRKTWLLLVFFSCALVACDKTENEESESNDTVHPNEFTIINNGSGAVTSITDTDDDEPLKIVQTIPSFGQSSAYAMAATKTTRMNAKQQEIAAMSRQAGTRADEQGTFPANMPILFFFNDKILLSSVADNLKIVVDGKEIKGTVMINEGANGFAILTFMPYESFKVNNSISVTIKSGIKDDGGNEMEDDVSLSYTTSAPSTGDFDQNKGFEAGTDGVAFIGDGAVISGAKGDVSPQHGQRFAAISTGTWLAETSPIDINIDDIDTSDPNLYEQYIQAYASAGAIGGASSMMILGPIKSKISYLSFYYDFISAEFDDYVNTEFDDCAMITVSGPKGAYSEFITSVNTIGFENQNVDWPGMPDHGDSKAGHIGWTLRSLTVPDVGTPAYITFTVTDVSDHILSSILTVDNISY